MAQTGVPFGDVSLVRDFVGVSERVERPKVEHPARPVLGFACPRGEVSGQRLWGFARDAFKSPERFFARFFVLNYCPLVFMEASGKNRTPDKLPKDEQAPLFDACDRSLARFIDALRPAYVIGVGAFAQKRAEKVLGDRPLTIGGILHPSPASPLANRNWAGAVQSRLEALGIGLP
jgi:single-strand selective monofunctional uracil DNA glycosylase